PNINVNIDVSGGTVDKTSATTDENGEVYALFTAQTEGSGYVKFVCVACTNTNNVEYSLSISEFKATSGAYEINWEKNEYVMSFEPTDTQKSILMSANTTPKAVNVSVEFATDQSTSIAWFSPNVNRTDENGEVTSTLTVKPNWNDWLKVIKAYVTTLSSGDTALVKVYKTLVWITTNVTEFSTGILDNVSMHSKEDGVDGYITLREKQTSNWLTGWTYRRAIDVTETSGSTLTGYQVLIELNTSNFDFSKAKSDGSDIRFTDSDGVTTLNYWIEDWSSSRALIWVRIPSISANSVKTIYVYYGNPTASSQSNGQLTFDFFDDFNDGDISDWTSIDANIQATTFGGKEVLKLLPGTATNYKHLAIPINCNLNLESYVVEAYIYDGNSAGSVAFHYRDDGNWWSLELYVGGNRDIFRPYRFDSDEGWRYQHIPVSISNGQWYRIRVDVLPSSFKMYINNELKWSRSVSPRYQFTGYSKVGFVEHKGFGPLYADWIFVRKYASQEPSVFIGNEEVIGYVTEGSYTSEVKDLSQNSSIIYFSWNGSISSGIDITFYVRASNESFTETSTSPVWMYVGKASDGIQFDLQSLNIIGRYVQWKAELSTNDDTKTPILDEVVVGYKPIS
ncbi:hypothetical protein DRP05_11725, partial [Archaeoglobales archaeon]